MTLKNTIVLFINPRILFVFLYATTHGWKTSVVTE